MTIEHKIVAGLEEIKAVVFECKECKAKVALTPEHADHPPQQCPNGHSWEWNIPAEYQTTAGSAFVFFLLALKKLRDPMIQKAGFKLFLEFDQPKPY